MAKQTGGYDYEFVEALSEYVNVLVKSLTSMLVVVTHSVSHALRLPRELNLYLVLVQCAVVKIL